MTIFDTPTQKSTFSFPEFVMTLLHLFIFESCEQTGYIHF